MEIKDMQDHLNELVTLLRKSEVQRMELVKEQKVTEEAVAVALSTPASVRPPAKPLAAVKISYFYLFLSFNWIINYETVVYINQHADLPRFKWDLYPYYSSLFSLLLKWESTGKFTHSIKALSG